MILSKNFTLAELIRTDTGLPNEPNLVERGNLKMLAEQYLQPIRDKWGPLKITSGYRDTAVNRKIGGKGNSQHLTGEAADFQPLDADLNDVMRWIVHESGLYFGQCIIEKVNGAEWIHISLPRNGRLNEIAMIYDGKEYKAYG